MLFLLYLQIFQENILSTFFTFFDALNILFRVLRQSVKKETNKKLEWSYCVYYIVLKEVDESRSGKSR